MHEAEHVANNSWIQNLDYDDEDYAEEYDDDDEDYDDDDQHYDDDEKPLLP